MNTLRSLIAGLRADFSIDKQRITIPLFVLGAALEFLRPCARQGETWTVTGNLITQLNFQIATLLIDGGVLLAGGARSFG